jgi:hypothetical protein
VVAARRPLPGRLDAADVRPDPQAALARSSVRPRGAIGLRP